MENGGTKAATLRLLRRMLPSFSSNDWFLRHRIAAQSVVDISNGLFYLLSRVYFGDSTQHWILCTSSGNAFRASYNELCEKGLRACIYCHSSSVDDLAAFGSDERIQTYSLWISNGNAVIAPGQAALGTNPEILIHCYVCGNDYHACLKDFVASAGEGNACPTCTATIRKHRSAK